MSEAVAARDAPARPLERRTFAPWTDPAAKPLISFHEVTKVYGETVAVDRLSLDIYPREFFALLGPSGCGKTTLMRLLAGFETPSGGDIRLEGQSVVDIPPHRRPINMMFQSYALFPHLSVWDNVAFGLRRDGLPRAEVRERVEEMLALVQLTTQARRRPDQLSGGQRQRVALARALVKRPRVLLLDEPLAALDKKLRGETQFELMNLQETIGITFLIVTHDQEEAMVLADRIAVMREGRIEQVATPGEVYESPGSRYVADFIGDINILEGTIERADADAVVIRAAGMAGPLVLPPDGRAQPGRTGWAAVRPEKMAMRHAADGPLPDRNALRGTVYDIAYMGDYTLFRIKTEAGTMEASRLNRRRMEEDPVSWDDEVVLSFDTADAVFLER